ncbi:MAG: hypothetical protein ACRDKZ_10380 [Actinomycetota bacterium]
MDSTPRRVAFVGADLMGRARIDDAVRRAGMELTVLASPRPGDVDQIAADLVLIDLDAAGVEFVRAWGDRGSAIRAIGYFSHVDATLGEAASAAGIEALPRGRFWRTLPEILGLPNEGE